MKEEDKDLNYWKENAKDAYMTTPICVLRYITELEKIVNNLNMPVVSNNEVTVCRCKTNNISGVINGIAYCEDCELPKAN